MVSDISVISDIVVSLLSIAFCTVLLIQLRKRL